MAFSFLHIIKPPSLRSQLQTELDNAERSLHQHETAALFSQKMAEYHRANIHRLKERINRKEA